MRHALGERGFHGGLALFFECLHLGWRSQEILRHVSAAAESWLKLFEHEKHLAIISTRLVPGLDVHGPNFAAVLSSGEVRTRAVMRVIKAEARWPGREHDPPLAMRRNERRAFLGRSVHVRRYHLAVPMQLLRRVRVVEHVYCDLPAFFKAKQWPRELPVVGSCRNNPVGRDLDRRRFDVQRVVGGTGSERRQRESRSALGDAGFSRRH